MDNITKTILLLVLYIPIIIVGGIVAKRKGDFFSRGAAICAITWFFGLIFMIKAPESKARAGDKEDLNTWHMHGAKGGAFFLICIVLYLLIKFSMT